jgi:hypothetical protein
MLGSEAQPHFRRCIRISRTGRRESTKQACTTDEIDADCSWHALAIRVVTIPAAMCARKRIRSGS